MAGQDSTHLRFGDVPIVTLNVGLPATAFHVHRDLLCYESPVFKAAFSENGHFLEAKNHTMDLVDDEAVVFEYISNWLYTRSVLRESDDKRPEVDITHIYATAERYGMVNLKNEVVRIYFENSASSNWAEIVPHLDGIKYIYSTTPQSSPLRKLVVALLTCYMRKSWVSTFSSAALSEVPDFAADLAVALITKHAGESTEGKVFQGKVEDYYEKFDPNKSAMAEGSPANCPPQ